ncbi:MAG: phosphodiester glycosidase family protein [Promethearchaeota archaeon]
MAVHVLIFHPNDIKYNENILQVGPLLLKDGIIQSDFTEFVKNAHEFESDITADRHPRTIFGFNDEFYFFLAVDGRTRKSAGLYLEECSDLVQQLGFTNAINMDGGASSTLIEGNRLINHPRIKLSKKLSIPVFRSERNISTAIIIVSDNFM